MGDTLKLNFFYTVPHAPLHMFMCIFSCGVSQSWMKSIWNLGLDVHPFVRVMKSSPVGVWLQTLSFPRTLYCCSEARIT
jgi:hypothetical protein